jgi:hypothetical protein
MDEAIETRTKEELKRIFPFEEGDVIEMGTAHTLTGKPYQLVVHYNKEGEGNFQTFDLDGTAWRKIGHVDISLWDGKND